jgi:hypothetical protein
MIRFVDFLSDDEALFLAESALVLLRDFGPEAGQNPVMFTVGAEVTAALVKAGRPVSEEHVHFLMNFAEYGITAAPMEAIEGLLSRSEAAAGLAGMLVARNLAQLEAMVLAAPVVPAEEELFFQGTCKTICNLLVHRIPELPLDRMRATLFTIIENQRTEALIPFFSVLTNVMRADWREIQEIAADLVQLLASQFPVWCPCLLEFLEVLLAFICNHTDWVAELGWGDDIVGVLKSVEDRRIETNSHDCAGIAKVFAALVQGGLVSAAAVEFIRGWAMDEVQGAKNEIDFHVGMGVLASVIARTPAVLPDQVMGNWLKLIADGWFSTQYYRLLMTMALGMLSTLSEELRHQLVVPIEALLRDAVRDEHQFPRDYTFLFRYPALMPIEALRVAQLADVAEGEEPK